MNKDQKYILEDFIVHFLPSTTNKRKYSGNELEYITRILDKVFIQNFGFNLSKTQISQSFHRLGYTVFNKHGTFDTEFKKTIRTDDKNSPFTAYNCFTFFNISPRAMRYLMLTTAKLSAITNPKKAIEIENMISKLQLFKDKTNPNE
jgi:hypothetical protein